MNEDAIGVGHRNRAGRIRADVVALDDVNGNRTFKNGTSYTYDAADQMTATGGVNYGYDASGNQTTRGGDTFSYDHENRLTQTVIGGTTSSSVYNGDGLRMSHTVSTQTTSYTWDVAASLASVLQDGTRTYVYGLDLISATDSGEGQTYFLYDGLGSTTGLTDGSGNNPVSYSYDAFGAIRSQTGSSVNYRLFTGEQRDSTESLYFLRARYYDPAVGRFLTRDPIMAGHAYAYVENNPTNFVDPSGLCHLLPCWGCPYNPVKCVEEGIDKGLDEAVERLPDTGESYCAPVVDFCTPNLQASAQCIRFPRECRLVERLGNDAAERAEHLFPKAGEGTIIDGRREFNRGDFFQHCYWSGLIALREGTEHAREWTSAYEATTDNKPEQRAFDLESNARGARFGERLQGSPDAISRLERMCLTKE